MRILTLTILIVVNFEASLFAQNIFSRTFGGADVDGAMSVVQLPDNGYVVAGFTGSFGNNANMLAIRLSEQGELVWLKTYGGPQLEGAEKVLFHHNQLYFLGFSNSPNPQIYDAYLVVTDLDGNELWSETFGGDDWEFGKEMIFINDSILVVASESYSFGNFSDVLLSYVNVNTREIQNISLPSPHNLQVIKLLKTEGDRLFIVSNFNAESGDTSGFQVYVTSYFSDQIEQSFIIPYSENTEFRDATLVNNGLVVVAGTFFPENNPYGETLVTLIDTAGAFIADVKSPVDDNFAYPINAVKYLQNDVCIFAGVSTFLDFNISRGAFFTSSGLIYFDNGRVFDGNVFDEFKDIIPTTDGGFMAVGNSVTFGPGISGALIVKINADLEFTLNVITGIDETKAIKNSGFQIYPNPTNEFLNIKSETIIEKIKIFDINGKVLNATNLQGSQILDVSNLPNGIYFLYLESQDRNNAVLRFIKN